MATMRPFTTEILRDSLFYQNDAADIDARARHHWNRGHNQCMSVPSGAQVDFTGQWAPCTRRHHRADSGGLNWVTTRAFHSARR